MTQIGYAISSEEHHPNDIVRHASLAEEAGFTFSLISDHYHPWIDRQGQAPSSGLSSVASCGRPSVCGSASG